MSYATMEAALQTQIQTLTGFAKGDRNVVLYDVGSLNRGSSKGVVLRFGGMDHSLWTMGGTHLHTWFINCTLYVRYKNESDAQEALRTNMQLIIDRIDQYPKLGGSAYYAWVSSMEETPEEIALGAAKFIGRSLRIAVEEEVDVTEME